MKKMYLAALAGILALNACKKETDNAGAAGDFQPLTSGSTWTYKETVANVTYTFTATNRDTSMFNKTYKVLSNSAGGNVYLSKTGNNYYRFGTLQLPGGPGLEEWYLVDNLNVNGTWEQSSTLSFNGTNYPVKLSYKINAKNRSLTVGTRNFTKVTEVGLTIFVRPAGFPGDLNLGSGTFFYEDGVGLVKSTLSVDGSLAGFGTINQNTEIQSYTIR